MTAPGAPSARGGWGQVRLSPRGIRESLRRRYRLGWHGYALGSATLLATWLTSHALMLGGLDSLALRYALSLGAGYAVYLLVLRWWAHRLVAPHRKVDGDDGGLVGDALDALGGSPDGVPTRMPPISGGGGDYGGGGASGDFGDAAADTAGWAGDALGAAAGADEAAIVVVPVVAVFIAVAALVLGVGALALLYFGSEVLLAVAVELAFSYAAARAATRVAREGWLTAAVRLTWKPLLGSLLCAVVLGAAIDWGLPDVRSLPDAVRMVRSS